jgi:hypothetical protein
MNRLGQVSLIARASMGGPSPVEFPDWPGGWYVLADYLHWLTQSSCGRPLDKDSP